jgi:hypothetical protein
MASTFSGSQLPKQLPISGAGFLVKAILSPSCMRKVSRALLYPILQICPIDSMRTRYRRNQTMHSRRSSHFRHLYASFTTPAAPSAYLRLPWLQLPALSQFAGGDPNSFGKPCRLNQHRPHVRPFAYKWCQGQLVCYHSIISGNDTTTTPLPLVSHLQLDLHPHLWGRQVYQWATLYRCTAFDDIPLVLLACRKKTDSTVGELPQNSPLLTSSSTKHSPQISRAPLYTPLPP